MAHIFKPRVAETSTTTGTGAFTLTGALTGHQTFASVMATSDTTEYVIVAVDSNGDPTGDWEEGVGTYSSANTLTRTTVTNSSNAGAAVTFAAGSKVVLMTQTAATVGGRFYGPARRILGDFDNGTVGDRLLFQTVTTNGVTDLGVVPNGTGAETYVTLNNSSDPANAARFQVMVKAAEARIEATKLGTGSYLPINVYTSGLQRLQIAADGTFTVSGDTVFDKAIKEKVFTITDGAAFEIDPSNGTIQTITLGASRTPKGTNFQAGEAVTLMVLDGTAYTLTWTDATWGGSGVVWVGGSAPTLDTTKYTIIELWKVGSQVYGASPGAA